MVDQMIHPVDVMVVEAHAGGGLVHVLAHALVAQDLVHVPEAVVEMIDAVDAMTLTAEVKGRADQDHTAAAKVATAVVRTAKARVTTETRGAR